MSSPQKGSFKTSSTDSDNSGDCKTSNIQEEMSLENQECSLEKGDHKTESSESEQRLSHSTAYQPHILEDKVRHLQFVFNTVQPNWIRQVLLDPNVNGDFIITSPIEICEELTRICIFLSCILHTSKHHMMI